MTPELIIFDCDGVLVDSEIVACRIDARELGRLGFQITAEAVAARFIGHGTQDMLDALQTEQGIRVPEDFRDHLLAATLNAFADELRAVPNVVQALDRLHWPLCVASSSDVARIEYSLELTGLARYFAGRIFSAQMVARGKPDPDLFEFAARSVGAAPAACLVIEDSVAGVQAGVSAGMRVFGYTGASHCADGHDARLHTAGASTVFDDMTALPALIAAAATGCGNGRSA